MKKQGLKKLSLTRESLRKLTDDHLSGVAAGNHLTVSRTHNASNCSNPCCTEDTCFTC